MRENKSQLKKLGLFMVVAKHKLHRNICHYILALDKMFLNICHYKSRYSVSGITDMFLLQYFVVVVVVQI